MKGIRQAKRNIFQRYFLDPFLGLVAFFFWMFFKVLPVRIASTIGAGIGFFLSFFMVKRNRIGLRNLEIAFPNKSLAERKEILKKMWMHFGRFYAEMPHGKTLGKTAKIQGLDYLKEAFKTGKGGFVCSAHIGNWEPMVSFPLFDHFYLNPVYRPANNPWLDKLMFQRRKGILIPKGSLGARKIVETIHKGGFVVMLCDQKLREGISVPFFGKPAMTAPAIAALSLRLNVPIFMAKSIRGKDGRLDVVVYPLTVSKEKAKSMEEASYLIMKRINEIIEDWIRETPEQWLWVHHRFDKSEYC